MRIANLRVMVTDEQDGRPILAAEPVPNLAVKLPPRGVPLTTEQLVIPGVTDPGNTITVNGLLLHLYYFESILEHHGICYCYKIGPNMMGIQVGYNKNYHRK